MGDVTQRQPIEPAAVAAPNSVIVGQMPAARKAALPPWISLKALEQDPIRCNNLIGSCSDSIK